MARIYAGAAGVLVLDPELQIEDRECSEYAVWMSPWMARSWTLQEGALSTALYIKFATEIQHFSSLRSSRGPLSQSLVGDIWRQDMLDEAHPGLSISSWTYALEEFLRIFGHEPQIPCNDRPIKRQIDRFSSVWNELSERSTTQPEDVAAILAALLNLSAGEILALQSPRDRMRALLKSQTTLPLAILAVTQMAPGSSRDWVPMFPSSDSTTKISQPTQMMRVTDNGFILEDLPILHAPQEADFPLCGEVFVCDRSNSQRRFCFNSQSGTAPALGPILLYLSGVRNSMNLRMGRCFEVVKHDEDGLHVRMGDTFAVQNLSDHDCLAMDGEQQNWYHVEDWQASTLPRQTRLIIDVSKYLFIAEVCNAYLRAKRY